MKANIFTDLETYEEFVFIQNFGIITLKDYQKIILHFVLYLHYLKININNDIIQIIWNKINI